MEKEAFVTYEPDDILKKGYGTVFTEIFNDIGTSGWLTWQLFKRDFLAIYRQSFIGVFWAVVIPFVSVGAFVILNNSGVFNCGVISVPYPVYAMFGMAFWQLFSIGLIAGSNSLVNAGSMVVKIKFSKKSLVIASTCQALVSFLIQIALAVLVCALYRVAPNPSILLIPIMVVPLLLLTLGISFIVSLLNGILRDVGNIISVLLTFLMFLTPVLYARPKSGLLAAAAGYNPLYYLISAPREMILFGTFTEWKGFLVSSAFSVIVFIVCIIIFHLTEVRVAERI